MKKRKGKMLFVMMLFVCSIGFSKLAHGMEEGLKQSLFLPADHWLHQKVAGAIENKTCYLFRMDVDFSHVIILKHGKDKIYNDSVNRVIINVLLKPRGAESYEDCEEKQGGYVSLFAYFTKPQKEELLEDEFSAITESTSTNCGFNQKITDQKMDLALERSENAAYRWINDGGSTRELVVPGCNGLGYVISKDGEQPVFFSLYHCVNLGIRQYTFTPWKEVQERIDRWQRLQNFSTRGSGGTFDLSKIKFGIKKS
ncbi:MAG: hypothetical protein LBF32_01005 [Streptococcaceae bacterium]|jgi:hypothetical protein|nr:hypothetical protein [Streptococcaceae bacterium]